MVRLLPFSSLPLLIFGLAGCPQPDKAADDTASVDADGDRYYAYEDCDDDDPDVHPNGIELCGGGDEDCDGLLDDADPDLAETVESSTFYLDLDGDGFGEADVTRSSCAVPDGFAEEAGDCNDGDAAVNPDADEACNGYDDNCDGSVDGPDATDATTFYTDSDGDGYGADSSAMTACEALPAAVAEGGDCDDGSAGIHPDAIETCDGVDEDCDGETDEDAVNGTTWYTDSDMDGFGDATTATTSCTPAPGQLPDGTDCDDTNASVNPTGPEACGGGDEDCDGLVDDDDPSVSAAYAWYADADADGYGNANVTVAACIAPTGFVADAMDCDDTDAATSPVGTEACGGGDEDCDGLTDDDDTDATGKLIWYQDADGDGYGDVTTFREACEQPRVNAVLDATDCDDANVAVYPGAVETCSSADDDCDGLTNEDDPDVTGTSLWYGDADLDGYGDPAVSGYYCSRPGRSAESGTDCDDTSAAVNPRATDLCDDGTDQDCYGGDMSCSLEGEWILNQADTLLIGTDEAGYSVDGDGDVDGDGKMDVIIGALEDTETGAQGGAVYVVPNISAGSLDLDTVGSKLTAASEGDYLGSGVALLDDMDGDGLAEVAMGAYYRDPDFGGEVYFLYGRNLPPVGTSLNVSNADKVWPGEHAYDYAGNTVVAAGDLNNDGFEELLVGSTGDSTAGYHAGSTYVINGAEIPTMTSLGDAQAYILGEDSGAHSARGLDGAGDFDGDGYGDIVVGAEGEDRVGVLSGAGYVILGPPTGSFHLDESDGVYIGEASPDLAGASVAGVGDTNNDGYDDIVIGARAAARGGLFNAGAAYLILGPNLGEYSLSYADAIFEGEAEADVAGTAVAGPGDMDGDGYDDIVVGAWQDSSLGHRHGAAYLIYGPASGTMSLAAADCHLIGDGGAGWAVSGVGDTDGDSLPDLIIGAPFGAGGSGAYLVRGRER